MNKIYKVVWNAARASYVVGSEFIKVSQTGGYFKNRHAAHALMAAVAACGLFWGAAPVGYAATSPTQYVAIKAEDGVTQPSGYYTQTVDGAYYYVKEGYHIVVEHDKPYYDGEEGFPATGNVIHVYRNTEEYANSHPEAGGAWEESDKNGLISSVQVMNADLRDEKGQFLITGNGDHLQEISLDTFVGVSQGGGTAVSDSYDYVILDNNNQWINAKPDDGTVSEGTHFAEVTYNETLNGYTYDGDLVPSNAVYVITKEDGTDVRGVFLTRDGKVYEGTVYGKNNEILVTGGAGDDLSSYWAGGNNDPNISADGGNLSTANLNTALQGLTANDAMLYNADVKQMTVSKGAADNSGTIGLINNAGNAISGITVAGTAEKGKDTQIQFSDGAGNSFAVDAGSRVTAKTDGDTNKLTGITINGKEYAISNGGTGGGAGAPVSGGDNIKVTGSSDTAYIVSLENDINLKKDKKETTISIHGSDGTISASNQIKAGGVTISGKDAEGNATDTVNGLKNKEWGGDYQYVFGQAATEDQLFKATDGLAEQIADNSLAISNLSSEVSRLDNRIDRVGAGAAALAALHPLDYDPEVKWDFAAGYGNYRGANAVSVGAFYRPNEDVMFSVGGSMGGGENMVNAGVSFKLGSGSGLTTSRTAMARELAAMKDTVAAQNAQIEAQAKQIEELTALVAQLAAEKAGVPEEKKA